MFVVPHINMTRVVADETATCVHIVFVKSMAVFC